MTTSWARMVLSAKTQAHVKDGYRLWSRIKNGTHIFIAKPETEWPSESEAGFPSIADAIEIIPK